MDGWIDRQIDRQTDTVLLGVEEASFSSVFDSVVSYVVVDLRR